VDKDGHLNGRLVYTRAPSDSVFEQIRDHAGILGSPATPPFECQLVLSEGQMPDLPSDVRDTFAGLTEPVLGIGTVEQIFRVATSYADPVDGIFESGHVVLLAGTNGTSGGRPSLPSRSRPPFYTGDGTFKTCPIRFRLQANLRMTNPGFLTERGHRGTVTTSPRTWLGEAAERLSG
jgi:hypothetical protein